MDFISRALDLGIENPKWLAVLVALAAVVILFQWGVGYSFLGSVLKRPAGKTMSWALGFVITTGCVWLVVWTIGRFCFLGVNSGGMGPEPVCIWKCSDRRVYAVFGKTSWYECEGESDDVRRYRIAAEQGDAEAQHYLGVRYADGRGVTQDPAEGMRWIRKAAEQGLLSAQYSLGVRFTDGKGIPKDYVRAHQWLSLAKRTELAAGPYRTFTIDESLAILEPKMAPDQIAEAQRRAREWWEKHEKTE